jgi:hypothetical protein
LSYAAVARECSVGQLADCALAITTQTMAMAFK